MQVSVTVSHISICSHSYYLMVWSRSSDFASARQCVRMPSAYCCTVYPACTSTPSHTPTASQYKSFRSIPSNKAYKNTNKYYNQNSSSRPDYEQYATTSLSVLLKPRTNFEKVDEADLETRLQVRKQSYILCLLMHLEK